MKQSRAEWKKLFTPARIGLLLFAAAIFVLGFIQARSKDRYSNILIATPFGDYDASAANVSEYYGQAVYMDEIDDLYPGTYHLEVNYQTTGTKNRIEYVDLENNAVLAEGTFSPDGTYWDATITLPSYVSRIGMRSYLNDGTLTVDSCYFTSTAAVYTDAFWSAALVLLLGGIGCMLYRRFRAGQRYGLLLFFAGLAVSLPFVSDHVPKGHDLGFHLARILGMATALQHGQFPVRLNETMLYGGGYLSPVIYPELFFYLPGVLCAAGASVLCAYKVLCLFINLATAWAGYQGMRRVFGDKIGFVFSLLFLLNPYRMNNLFIRAAIGEVLAMAFLPLAAGGLYDLMQGDLRHGFWEAILGITGVFQSHMLTMLMLMLFGGAYVAVYAVSHLRVYFADIKRFLALCAAAVATILVNLWFLVPFLVYSRWDMGIFTDKRGLGATAITPFQAFMDIYHYGSDISGSETAGEMSQTIGFALLFAAVLFIVLCLTGKLESDLRQKGGVCLMLGGFAWFMSTDLFPWDAVQSVSLLNRIFGSFQYAWRFLIGAALLLSAVAAVVFVTLLENRRFCAASVMACLVVGFAATCCSSYLQINDARLKTKSDANWEHNAIFDGQYLLCSSDSGAVSQRCADGGVICTSDTVSISDYSKAGVNLNFSFANPSGEEMTFQLPLYSYGMHRAYLDDGQALTLTADDSGMLCIVVPAGQSSGTVHVHYCERRLFRAAEAVSLLSVIGLCAFAWYSRRKGKPSPAQPA
jgi:hypothetical protein